MTRVLVVESDGLLAETYRRFLAREEFYVRTAGTANDCLRCIPEFSPDVVVLELEVVASSAEAGSKMANVPIIVVTRQDLQRKDMPDNWHIASHFVKPVSMARLANAVREATRR